MAVEISGTDHRLLTTHGTPASMKPAGRPTNSSALPFTISIIPVSQAERVIHLAEDMSTTSFWRSAKLRVRPPTRYSPDWDGSFQL
jgi:hypothetical protein